MPGDSLHLLARRIDRVTAQGAGDLRSSPSKTGDRQSIHLRRSQRVLTGDYQAAGRRERLAASHNVRAHQTNELAWQELEPAAGKAALPPLERHPIAVSVMVFARCPAHRIDSGSGKHGGAKWYRPPRVTWQCFLGGHPRSAVIDRSDSRRRSARGALPAIGAPTEYVAGTPWISA